MIHGETKANLKIRYQITRGDYHAVRSALDQAERAYDMATHTKSQKATAFRRYRDAHTQAAYTQAVYDFDLAWVNYSAATADLQVAELAYREAREAYRSSIQPA